MIRQLRYRLLKALSTKPKTRIAAGGSDQKSSFTDERARTIEQLKSFERVYDQGGIVSEGLDCYALFTLSKGWRFEGEEHHLDMIDAFMDGTNQLDDKREAIDFHAILWQGIMDAVVYGDAFQEIVRNAGGDIIGIIPRSPVYFTAVWDDTGITGYEQKIDDDTAIPLDCEQIVHIRLYPSSSGVYGKSIIGRAMDEIKRDADIAESTSVAIKRHAYRKYHVQVGAEGETIPETVITGVRKEFEKLESKNDFVTDRDVSINGIDIGALGGVKENMDVTITRLCAALGVPEEFLGLGRGSTEATAKVRLKTFYDKIGTIQKAVARIYEIRVLDAITGEPGAVKIVFNDVDPADEAAKAEWIANMMKSTPMDTFAILPRVWIQKQFDIDPDEYETEEEDLPPMMEEEVPEEPPVIDDPPGTEAETPKGETPE